MSEANGGSSLDYTEKQFKAFLALGVVELVLYTLLLGLAIYNTCFFLYKQKRYRIYFITVFYVLSYIVILVRIALAILVLMIAANGTHYESEQGTFMFVGLTLEIVATYAKIMIGFFQVGAIVILTLQVRELYLEHINRISFWTYFIITVGNGMLLLGVVIFSIVVYTSCKDAVEGSGCVKRKTDIGVKLNEACFVTLSICLIVTMIPLFGALLRLSKGRMELSKGIKMLFAVFAIFTLSYTTRTIYDIFIGTSVSFGGLFSGLCLPLFWDFLPTLLMFGYHFQNMREHERERRMMYSNSYQGSAG